MRATESQTVRRSRAWRASTCSSSSGWWPPWCCSTGSWACGSPCRENRDNLAELQGEKAAGAAATLSGFFEEVERHMASVTWGDPPAELRNTFRRILFQVPALTDLRYLDADGRERALVSRITPDALGSSVDRSGDVAFTRTRTEQSYYGAVVLPRAAPRRISPSPAALRPAPFDVVVGDVNLSLVNEVVSDITVGDDGYAYAVDSEGVLVAHPDLSLVLGRRDLSSLDVVRDATASRRASGATASRPTDSVATAS